MKQIENDNKGNARFSFAGKLLSIGGVVLTNSNGKNYVVGTVEFTDAKGKMQRTSALIYEGNYSHPSIPNGMQIGHEYLCTATLTQYEGKPSVIVQISHLDANAPRADVSMFEAVGSLQVAGEINS